MVRSLAILAALLLAATSPSHAYKVRTGEVYEVPGTDRVSAMQRFARDADLISVGLPYIKLTLTVPGRVYIRHVKNDTAVAVGLFGKLRASGDTRGAVEYVAFPEPGRSPTSDAGDAISITTSFETSRSAHQSESLLLDVELYQTNALKEVTSYGSADVVIVDYVLYAAPAGKTMADVTEIRSGRLFDNMLPGNLFVSDPTARFSTSTLSVSTAGFSSVQLDFAALNSTETELWVLAKSSSNVTLFASEFVSPILMEVEMDDGEATPRNPLCVATKDDVKLTMTTSKERQNPTTSVIAGGSSCTKLALPPREPALIGEETGTPNDVVKEVTIATFAPPASASPKPATFGPTSSAWSLASSPALVGILVLLLGW